MYLDALALRITTGKNTTCKARDHLAHPYHNLVDIVSAFLLLLCLRRDLQC